MLIVGVGLAGAALLIGGYWYFRIRPRVLAIENPYHGSEPRGGKTLEQVRTRERGFDLAYELPGSPLGAATDGNEIVLGNRVDPWGAIRLRPARKGEMRSEKVPIIEPQYGQKISINALTFNGKDYVGLTTGSWFQRQNTDVFTIHDRSTLQVKEWRDAPPLVGCLAWDGQSYWAATRRHTADAPQPALLYHLDRDFKVLTTSPAPGVGCQGLSWDGRNLWFADVFSDSIYVIEVAGEPRVIHTASTPLSYLSGVVAYDGEIWIADYDRNRLQRVEPATRLAWAGATPASAVVAAATFAPFSTQDNEPIASARDENRFADRLPDDTEMIDWSVELREGAVFGSWRIWFGPDLFIRREQDSSIVTLPQFARYTVTVDPPGDAPDIERQFDAVAAENVMNGVRLADAVAPGEYRVSVFIHVQYVKADGQGQILNRSSTSLRLRK